jgi:subtilisin
MSFTYVSGRYLVLLRHDAIGEGTKALSEHAQLSIAEHTEASSLQTESASLGQHCAIIFDRIGVALVYCAADKQTLLSELLTTANNSILAVEPERTVYAIATHQRDHSSSPVRSPKVFDESTSTWGIQAVGADKSGYTGKGVRLAVLDTGLDLEHPDFAGRKIVAASFVAGETAHDGNGHGTHCAGIAGGPASPSASLRYGVAGGAELYIGKVLSDEGSGGDGGVLEGINWAIENQCRIISMSLGSHVQPGQTYSRIFEEVAKRALEAGTVIIAAAGNDSRRPESIAPVSHPANCPSIMAVAAIDRAMQVAPFSSGGLHADGGQVDLAAPGVEVLSSWPAPEPYNTLNGTSMATPFVAGVAALYAEADAGIQGKTLLTVLTQKAAPLNLPEQDVGAGIVQAP